MIVTIYKMAISSLNDPLLIPALYHQAVPLELSS